MMRIDGPDPRFSMLDETPDPTPPARAIDRFTNLEVEAMRTFCQWHLGHQVWADDIIAVADDPMAALTRLSGEGCERAAKAIEDAADVEAGR